MASDAHQSDDFLPYPTNRVVGTIADATRARAAIEALLQAGFAAPDIDILHDEEDLHRREAAGAEHTFLVEFQRTLLRTLAGRYNHLRHYVEDVRAGRWVIMVLAKKRHKRELAADVLGTHGAEFIEFYGRWAWQSLEPHPAAPADSPPGHPTTGRTYEIDLGGAPTHVRLDSPSRATILRASAGAPDLSHLPVMHLRPDQLMVAWQDADRTTNVHIYDFESGEAHAVVTYADRRVHRSKGTVRPVSQTVTAKRSPARTHARRPSDLRRARHPLRPPVGPGRSLRPHA